MKKQIIISILSKDRTGIVADIAGIIFDLNGDLADLNQSVLCGFFNMIVIVWFDNNISIKEITDKFSDLKSETKLEVIVKEVSTEHVAPKETASDNIYIITAQGKNRTGLVASIGSFCRDSNINIIDYDTKLSGDIYSMMLEVDLSESKSAELIYENLEIMAKKIGLHVVMQHKSLFDTINEINLY